MKRQLYEIKKDKTHKKFPSHHINMIKNFLSIQTIIPKPLILPTYTKVLLLSIQKTMLCPGFFHTQWKDITTKPITTTKLLEWTWLFLKNLTNNCRNMRKMNNCLNYPSFTMQWMIQIWTYFKVTCFLREFQTQMKTIFIFNQHINMSTVLNVEMMDWEES